MNENFNYKISISKEKHMDEAYFIDYLLTEMEETFPNYISKIENNFKVTNKGIANLIKEIDKFKSNNDRIYKYLKNDSNNRYTTGDVSDFYQYRKGILEEKIEKIKIYFMNELIRITICEVTNILIILE